MKSVLNFFFFYDKISQVQKIIKTQFQFFIKYRLKVDLVYLPNSDSKKNVTLKKNVQLRCFLSLMNLMSMNLKFINLMSMIFKLINLMLINLKLINTKPVVFLYFLVLFSAFWCLVFFLCFFCTCEILS